MGSAFSRISNEYLHLTHVWWWRGDYLLELYVQEDDVSISISILMDVAICLKLEDLECMHAFEAIFPVLMF